MTGTALAADRLGRERAERALSSGAQAGKPDESERRVVRQLVEALLFEGLVERELGPRPAADVRGDDFEAIYDLRIHFKVGRHDVRCLATIRSFSRIRVAQGSVEWVVDGK